MTTPLSPPVPHAVPSQTLLGLPAAAATALAGELRELSVAAATPLREQWGGVDALGVVLEGRAEWTVPSPGRPAPPARVAGPHRPFLARRLEEEGAHPRLVRSGPVSRVAWVSVERVEELAAQHPSLTELLERLRRREALTCMHEVLGTLDDDLLDEVESKVEWRSLTRGEVLFEEGTRSDGLYFVIAGRLKAVQQGADGDPRVLGTIGPGEPAGEVAFFTGGLRGARVQAARNSLVVQLSDGEFDALAARRPQLARAVARSVVERVQSGVRPQRTTSTVVLFPAGDRLPAGIVDELAGHLARFGGVLRLDRAAADARMGGCAAAPEGTPEGERADAWLEAAESANRFMLLVADAEETHWTHRCLRQADRVLVVADASDSPAPRPAEALLDPAHGATEAAASLVLLHPAGTTLPSGTRRWLTARPWVASHHHVRQGEAAPGGLSRVARALAERSVGLVLGGGGARGFAHIGILRALEEAGVPVDRIAGTSMGASMAAQWAMGWGVKRMLEVNRRVWIEMRPHKVLTLPIVSIVSTRKAQVCGRMMYGESELEDLWVPFFCVSSSLTRAAAVVHRTGSLLDACTASASLPGFAPPVLVNGELLVDGALLNNVPADLMRADGAGVVIAAEVSPESERVFTCERVPTAWEALRGRWSGKRFPSILEVMMRASMLHSIGREREIASQVDLFLHPPIDAFPMMDFNILDDVSAAGYAYAREALAGWLAERPELATH